MATKRSGAALRMPKATKMPKLAYKVRKQVLAMDALLDVFSYTDRHTLDDANVVSAAFNATAQRASPLRIVKDAHFYHCTEDHTFHVTVYYNRATKGGTKNQRKAMRVVADNMDEATLNFFRSLRFCNVSRRIRLFNLRIQQPFVDQLKAVAKQFLCKVGTLAFFRYEKKESISISDEIREVIATEAGKETGLATLSWIDRPSKYRDILKRSIDQLKRDHPGVAFSGAMYLPYAKGEKSQHCFERIDVSGHHVNGANYVIKHNAERTRESRLNALLAGSDVVSEMNALLDYVL
ncbi:hypothetical protein AAVH_15869 [Aphelenchoides avenae]|nr:hypothetical protein AAVH_15869 [Aphelenchus avenae]